MAEIVNMRTREIIAPSSVSDESVEETRGFVSKIMSKLEATRNDYLRSRLTVRQFKASENFMAATYEWNAKQLGEVFDKLRSAPYWSIDMWAFPDFAINDTTKNQAQENHTLGVFRIGEPSINIVWQFEPKNKIIHLFTSEEFFIKYPTT